MSFRGDSAVLGEGTPREPSRGITPSPFSSCLRAGAGAYPSRGRRCRLRGDRPGPTEGTLLQPEGSSALSRNSMLGRRGRGHQARLLHLVSPLHVPLFDLELPSRVGAGSGAPSGRPACRGGHRLPAPEAASPLFKSCWTGTSGIPPSGAQGTPFPRTPRPGWSGELSQGRGRAGLAACVWSLLPWFPGHSALPPPSPPPRVCFDRKRGAAGGEGRPEDVGEVVQTAAASPCRDLWLRGRGGEMPIGPGLER